jgi:hypothetical protein
MVHETTHITEGSWKVCSREHQTDMPQAWTEYVVVMHRCNHRENGLWYIHVYHPSTRNRLCQYCHEPAPEGIQMMHWFLHESLHKDPNIIRKYA